MVRIDSYENGKVEGTRGDGVRFRADVGLMIVRKAWSDGMDVSDLVPPGTDGDWSFVRDADAESFRAMFERAVNYLGLSR